MKGSRVWCALRACDFPLNTLVKREWVVVFRFKKLFIRMVMG